MIVKVSDDGQGSCAATKIIEKGGQKGAGERKTHRGIVRQGGVFPDPDARDSPTKEEVTEFFRTGRGDGCSTQQYKQPSAGAFRWKARKAGARPCHHAHTR